MTIYILAEGLLTVIVSRLDSSHELDLNQYFRATCLLVDREWVCRPPHYSPPRIEWNIRPVAEFYLVTNDPAKLTCRPFPTFLYFSITDPSLWNEEAVRWKVPA